MSYNGSGTFQINSSGQPVVTGTVISSTAFNALTADLATGLSTAVTKDGQTTTTARVPFAQGISSTLVTDATSATTGSIITAGGISTQKALWVGTTTTLAGTLTAAAIAGSGNYTLTNSVNGDAQVYILNSNGGASADAILRTSNGTNVGYFGSNGTGAATAGVLNANNAFVRGTHGLSLCADTGAVSVGTTSAEWARFSSGNLGIGVTPSAWSSVTGLQTGLGGSFVGNTGASTAYVISNAYYNGSAWKAINTGASCSMQLDNVGQCLWSTAASVSAGSTVSFGEVARIGSDGSFLV